MDGKLTFKDFEKINDALVQVEQLVFEYSKKLSESKNYADLEVVAKLKIKLDEVENIIIDECRARREKVNLFEQPMTLEEQLELSESLNDFLEMYVNEFYDEVEENETSVDNLCKNLHGLYKITRKLVHRADRE